MKKQDKDSLERYLNTLELIRAQSQVKAFETIQEQNQQIELCKTNVAACVIRYFPHYASSPSADFQIAFAKKVLKDKTFKGFAQWGRGLAKSVWCDVIIPFHLWLNNEAHYMVLVGHNHDMAKQLLGDLQAEFEANPQIIKDFGEQKLDGSWEHGKFRTKGCNKRGLKPFIARACGMGQSVRGLRIGSQRPDLCVVDDVETRELIANEKRQDNAVKWVKGDLVPTMDGAIRRLLYSNNRFAPRMIQTELQKLLPHWHISHVPAYDKVTYQAAWPQKYPPGYYQQIETDIGKITAWEEYVQEADFEGKIFTKAQINWQTMPQLHHFKVIVGHWDIAYAGTPKSDYNAVKIWGLCKDNFFWYIQGFVKQTKMAEAVTYICEVEKARPKNAIILWQYEAQFWNDEVQRTIEEQSKLHNVQLNITKVKTVGNKYSRIMTMQPRYQNNRIKYNAKMEADNDTQVGIKQLFGIEPGYTTKDDSPDADHQCIEFLQLHLSVGNASSEIHSGRMEHKHDRI